jgi:ATP-dependent DNA helicase PIF1
MLQLPAVSKGKPIKFPFESEGWKNAKVELVLLTELVRQKGDNEFGTILNEIRIGNKEAARKLIDNKVVFPDDGIRPVVLYCLNKYVDSHNEAEMMKLPGMEKKYFSQSSGDAKSRESLEKNCPAPPVLKLKVGAQVILLKNLDQELGLVNGSLGVVVSLANESVVVKFESGEQTLSKGVWELKKQSIEAGGSTKFKVAATVSQIPLKLAYSLSIHRSQGQTLSRVVLDATGAFEDGLIYVGLSRVENQNNIIIKNLNINKITANPKALEFYGYSVPSDDPFDF